MVILHHHKQVQGSWVGSRWHYEIQFSYRDFQFVFRSWIPFLFRFSNPMWNNYLISQYFTWVVKKKKQFMEYWQQIQAASFSKFFCRFCSFFGSFFRFQTLNLQPNETFYNIFYQFFLAKLEEEIMFHQIQRALVNYWIPAISALNLEFHAFSGLAPQFQMIILVFNFHFSNKNNKLWNFCICYWHSKIPNNNLWNFDFFLFSFCQSG